MSSDWYAKRLQGDTPPKRGLVVGPPAAPAPAPIQQAHTHTLTDVASEPQSLSEFLRSNGTKGSIAARQEGGFTCPSCGSSNVFSQTQQAMMSKDGEMVKPNPKCFECGWNGRFTQADQASWA